MKIINIVLSLQLSLFLASPANADVSGSRQSCILQAMSAGAAALGNPAELVTLYQRYFDGDKVAQLAAGNYWNQYDDAKKDAQRGRVQQVVVQRVAPSLSRYKGSEVRFTGESGMKVRGVVKARDGERRKITWFFDGSACKFINVSIDGLGSLIGLVGKEPLK
jgi:hypothetical protein